MKNTYVLRGSLPVGEIRYDISQYFFIWTPSHVKAHHVHFRILKKSLREKRRKLHYEKRQRRHDLV
jgi:hypothetical protein